jgi:hypothetical protein
MAMKEFNFKQFMLQNGEWVGLGFALVIALPVLGFGMIKILSSASATKNVLALNQLAQSADARINSAKPPDDADKPPKEFFADITYERVDPDAFNTPTDWFVASSIEDTRRRSPEILPPGEFHVDVVRGAMKGQILTDDGKRVAALKDRPSIVIKDRRTKKIIKITPEKLSGAGSYGGYGGRGMPGGPGVGGERGPMGPAYGASAGAGAGAGGLTLPSTTWVDVDKVGPETHLAETLYPVRMVMVTATFPFRQQLEEFRRALKKRTLDELFLMFNNNEATWEFKNFDIQRRVLYPNGMEKTPWQDYDKELNSKFAAYFAVAADYDKEEADFYKYEGILNKGLMMVRPQLERGQYPKVDIASIKSAIAKLDKESQGEQVKRPLSDLSRKLQKKGLNPYDVYNPLLSEEEEEANKQPAAEKPASDSSEKKPEKKDNDAESEMLLPETALVRFMDVTVEPGFVYQYRIKVKMANPNFHQNNLAYQSLRDLKEIEASEWTSVPPVLVPYDVTYYAMDEKPDARGDRTKMEVHRWIDRLLKDPQNVNTETRVGDWSIATNVPVHRGEYNGRTELVEVPVWNVEKEDFELAVNPKNKLERKLPVDFTARTRRSLDPALLVDFQGGKDIHDRLEYRTPENKPKTTLVTDTVPVQLLILTPEGKLVVHSQHEDSNNEERKDRYKAWKDWISDVKNGRRKPKPDEPFMDQFRGGGKNS